MTAAPSQPAAAPAVPAAPTPALTDAHARSLWSSRGVVLAGLMLLMLVGGALRFVNLDALSLQVDEGFQALAVGAILEHGYPMLDSGYVYGRSPLFLYTQAAVASLLGLSEWSLRVPAAAFGVLGIPIAYLLGRRLTRNVLPSEPFNASVAVGLVLAAFVALSAWQIEYARYGRFYTLFQCLYMLGLIAFHAGWCERKLWGKLLFVPLFLLTVSVHDLGVMLGLCFWAVLPLSGVSWRTKATYFVLSGCCGAAWVLYNKMWRGLQESWASAWPDTVNDGTLDIVVNSSNPIAWALGRFASMFPGINTPDLSLYLDLWDTQPLVPGLLMLPATAATVALSARKLREKKMEPHRIPEPTGKLWLPLLLTAVWTAALHQFALSAVALLVYAAVHVRSWRRWLRPAELLTLLSIGVAFVCWVGYFWRSDLPRGTWIPAISNVPGVHKYFLQWFIPGWTRMLVLIVPAALVVTHFAVQGLRSPSRKKGEASAEGVASEAERINGPWLLLVSIVVPILVTAELKWQFSESRYFLHLYPMMLGVLAFGVAGVGLFAAARLPNLRYAGLVATLAAATFTIGFTKDLNPVSGWDAVARTHDSDKDPIRSVINFRFYADWPQDQRTATLAALDQIGPDDAVLVAGPAHIAANYTWYLDQHDEGALGVDYIASTLPIYNSSQQDDQGRWIDLVSGGEVVHETARLFEITEQVEARGGRLWVLSDDVMVAEANWYLSDAEPTLKAAVAALMDEPRFTGRDGRTTVSVHAAPAARLTEALPDTFEVPEAPLEPVEDADAPTTTAVLINSAHAAAEATP
ncbi:MAG: hypothetical protein AAGH92_08780 [Planctomycetota bacterium]